MRSLNAVATLVLCLLIMQQQCGLCVAASLVRTYIASPVCQAGDGYVWRISRPAGISPWPPVEFIPNASVLLADDLKARSLDPGTGRYYRSTLRPPLPTMVALGHLVSSASDGDTLTLYAPSSFSAAQSYRPSDLPISCFCDVDVRCVAPLTERYAHAWVGSLQRETLPDFEPSDSQRAAHGTWLLAMSTRSLDQIMMAATPSETQLSSIFRNLTTLAMVVTFVYALTALVYIGASILPDTRSASYFRYKARRARLDTEILDNSNTNKE